jgi:carbonic anhydrase
METFSNDIMSKLLSESLVTAAIDNNGWKNTVHDKGSPEGKYINWLTIADQKQSIIEDLNRIRNHPLVNRDIPIKGYLYDVRSGKLTEVQSI